MAPSGGGKTKVLQDVNKEIKTSLINVNLELSHLMIDFTPAGFNYHGFLMKS